MGPTLSPTAQSEKLLMLLRVTAPLPTTVFVPSPQRSAAVAQSLNLASSAQLALNQNDTDLALALALAANEIPDPPPQAKLILADAGYAPGTRRVLEGHEGPVQAVAVSPDGRFALSGGADQTMRLWDLDTGELAQTFTGHTAPINAVAILPNGQEALSAADDGILRLWDLNSGQPIRAFDGRSGPLNTLSLSRDGQTALSGSEDATLLLWDLTTGDIIRRLEGHSGAVLSTAISPDGRLALSGGADRDVVLWDLDTGEIRYRLPGNETITEGVLTEKGHHGPVWNVAFTPDGQTAISGADDEIIIRWQIDNPEETRTYLRANPSSSIYALAVHPDDGRTLLLGFLDSRIARLHTITGDTTQLFLGHDGRVLALSITPDGRTAVSASSDGTVRQWNLEHGALVRRVGEDLTVPGYATLGATSIDLSPAGELGVIGHWTGALSLWAYESGEIVRSLPGHTEALFGGTLFTPDGDRIVSGSGEIFAEAHDTTVRVWDVSGGEELRQFRGHTDKIWDIDVSSDGRYAISAGHDGALRRWNLHTGEGNILLDVAPQAVRAVAFSPDGRRAAIGSINNTAVVWDVTSGEMLRRFPGHHGAVVDLTFTPDGQRLLVAVAEGEVVREWRVDDTQSKLQDWITANRYVPKLTCEQQIRYNIVQTCRE